MKRWKKFLYYFLFAIVLAVFLFSAYQLFLYLRESRISSKVTQELTDKAVVIKPQPVKEKDKAGGDKKGSGKVEGETGASGNEMEEEDEGAEKAEPPISVDFEVVWQTNEDVKAWLYCEDTPINYPVVQAADNDYYLHRLLDGRSNKAGTLFMDYRNQEDFSDWNTFVYGHNMKNNSMFGTLTDYSKEGYYEKHPVWYLLTPQQDYRIELLAGYVTKADGEIYTIPQSMEEKEKLLYSAMRKSHFDSDAEVLPQDRLITFSTCSYAYDDARYVVIGVLKKLGEKEFQTNALLEPEDPANENLAGMLQDKAAEVMVQINTGKRKGSGVIFDMNRDKVTIVTAAHVLEGTEELEITLADGTCLSQGSTEGTRWKVTKSGTTDIAFIEFPTDTLSEDTLSLLRYVVVDKQAYDVLKAGDAILVMGSEKEVAGNAYQGTLLEPWIYVEDYRQYMMLASTYARPGMSGGGVFDMYGRFLGVLSGADEQGNLAIVPLGLILAQV